jgi:hypothetical protein
MKGGAAAAADLVRYVEKCANKVVDNSGIGDVVENIKDIQVEAVNAENSSEKIDNKELAADMKAEEVRAKEIIGDLPGDIDGKDRAKVLQKIEKILSGKIRDVLPAIDTLIDAIELAHTKEIEKMDAYIDAAKNTSYAKNLRNYKDSLRSKYATTQKWIQRTRATIVDAIKGKDPDAYIKYIISIDNHNIDNSNLNLKYVGLAGLGITIVGLLDVLMTSFIAASLLVLFFGGGHGTIFSIMRTLLIFKGSIFVAKVASMAIIAILFSIISLCNQSFWKPKTNR